MLQFSQNSFSENWHQGGNNFFSLLSVVSGHFNYESRERRVRWNNAYEWRMGLNTVNGDPFPNALGDTIRRRAMPSDDMLRINSEFNVRAVGAFAYSASAEFQTHFFNRPANPNSLEMRTRFLTPVEINAGIGMTYQVNNLWDNRVRSLSVEFSPLSFRYVYLHRTDTTDTGFFINPGRFGINPGENQLQEFGSRVIVRTDFRPIQQLRINSLFNFFTNYEGVLINWEITSELTFSRFFSARLMLNPRFDTIAILPEGERARIQNRQILTVGFSYRFL
jgi:hypothetical protein